MFVEPGVEVNAIPHAAAPETHAGHAELIEQGRADAEVGRSLVLGQTARSGQRQAGIVHHRPRAARSYGFTDSPSLSRRLPVSTSSGTALCGRGGSGGGLSRTL